MKSPTILVVDDDDKLLPLLSRTLKRAGFTVLTADDGSLVPEILERHHVDLLLLDLQMPGMNGWEVLRKLSRPEVRESDIVKPKVIVMSGRDEDDTAAFVRRLGADGYLMKPVWTDALLGAIKRLMPLPAHGQKDSAHDTH